MALNFPSPKPDEAVAGILGYDFIRRCVVELDFANSVMRFEDPGGFVIEDAAPAYRLR